MNKIFSLLVFSIFLIGMASAMTVYGGFPGGAQSATINNGNSIKFSAGFISMNLPMNIKIELYNGGNLVYTFLSQSIDNANTYQNSYTITPSIYLASGNYELRISGTDKENSDYQSLFLTINSVTPTPTPDTIKPVITFLGTSTQTVIKGNPYHEYGATATDNIDGDLTSQIIIDSSDVNVNAVGTYFVTYNVKDSSGNQAVTKIRTVNVVSSSSPDLTPPAITVISPEDKKYTTDKIILRVITDEQADVTFRLDEGAVIEMSNPSDNLFTYTIYPGGGNHIITFYATDISGNTAREYARFSVEIKESNNNVPARVIGDSFYDKNRYYDQFENKNIIYTPKLKSQSGENLIIVLLVTLIIAFLIILTALVYLLRR